MKISEQNFGKIVPPRYANFLSPQIRMCGPQCILLTFYENVDKSVRYISKVLV